MSKKYLIYAKTCFKLQMRQYVSMFFTLIFPIIMTLIFVSAFGKMIPGFNFINKYFFIAVTLSVIAMSTLSIPLSFSFDLKLNILKQLKCLDVEIVKFKVIDIVISVIIMYIEVIILLIFSKVVYNLEINSVMNVFKYLLLLLPGVLSISFLGTMLALLVKQPESYMPVGITFMMVLLALSGCLGFDPTQIDNAIFKIYEYLPSYYMANSLYDVWFGGNFNYINYFISCFIFAAIGLVICGLNVLKTRGFKKTK